MSILEIIGIASIFPFMQLLIDPEVIKNNIILVTFKKLLNEYFGIVEVKDFQFLFGLTVFLILITSILVRALTYYIQIRFSYLFEYSIGKKLMRIYLSQSYEWFLEKNTSSLKKNILSEVNKVIVQGIMPLTTVLAQGSLVISVVIVCTFFITDASFILNTFLVLFTIYFFIYFVSNFFLNKLGNDNLIANNLRFKILGEVFNSIKEVKVSNSENIYIENFDRPSKIYATSQSSNQLISNLPRYILEITIFGGIILFLIIAIKSSNELLDIVPTLSVYAFAGYRLIPSLQQVYYSLSQIKYAESAIDLLNNDLKLIKNINLKSKKDFQMNFTKSIKLNNVTYKYPNSNKTILKNINICIPAFSKVGIIGKTGSGKSTIVDIILGLISPSEGNIKIDENILKKKNIVSWQKNIGYVPQQINLIDDTIAANIFFGFDKNNIDYSRLRRCLKMSDLEDFVMRELPDNYNTIIGEKGVKLSGGQRQRLGIARALYNNPKVIIFDEATNALDSETETKIINLLYNLGKSITIIMISHRLITLKNCDKLFLIHDGTVKAKGTYDYLIKNKFILNTKI